MCVVSLQLAERLENRKLALAGKGVSATSLYQCTSLPAQSVIEH